VALTAPTRPAWLQFTSSGSGSGVLEGTPSSGDTGAHSVVLRASDGNGGTAQQSFSIQVGTSSGPIVAADAFVRAGSYANTNFGSEIGLTIKNDKKSDNTREVYIRFDLSSVSATTIARAVVRLVPVSVGSSGQVHRAALVSSNDWGEQSITWNTKPVSGGQLGTDWTPVAGQPVEIDVTAAVIQALGGNRMLSLHIFAPNRGGSSDISHYASREHQTASAHPRLILDTSAFTVDDVFIIAGQSNAEGRGDASKSPLPAANTAFEYLPATNTFKSLQDPVGSGTGSAWPAFARKWHELTGRTSAFVSTAVGGTPNSALINSTSNWENGSYLKDAVAAANQLVARVGGSANVTVLWSQGERDAKAILDNRPKGFSKSTYKAAFETTISTFQKEKWKNFRLVISETGTNVSLGDVGYSDVRAAQREVAGSMAAVITGFTGAYGFAARGLMADDLHYKQAGYNEMGEAMAVALAAARGYSRIEDPAIAELEAEIPQRFELGQNYPNPFNPSTIIAYQLSEAADVDLAIYNVVGQRIRVLAEGALPAGRHQVMWDGRDESGQAVSSGVYLYRLVAGTQQQSRTMILVK
jgi:hypothetical protein